MTWPEFLTTVVGTRKAAQLPNALASEQEAALWGCIAERDQGAFASLYAAHGSRCYALALRVSGSPITANAAVTEVFVAVWNGSVEFDARRGTLQALLLIRTHSSTVDLMRRAASPSTTPTARAGRIQAAFAALPEGEAVAIDLTLFGGLTCREAAARLNVSVSLVQTRIRNALAAIRDCDKDVVAIDHA